MTEQEMLEALDGIWTFGHEPTDSQREAVRMARGALEELRQYRGIGTVEEIRELKEISFSGMELACIATGMTRLKKYEAIGTVEECREAVEKREPVKITRVLSASGYKACECGNCGNELSVGPFDGEYCHWCGRKLDWGKYDAPGSRGKED